MRPLEVISFGVKTNPYPQAGNYVKPESAEVADTVIGSSPHNIVLDKMEPPLLLMFVTTHSVTSASNGWIEN